MGHHAFDRGGEGDGTLSVSLDTFYGTETVCVELADGATFANLTAATAREVARDLLAHADTLDPIAPGRTDITVAAMMAPLVPPSARPGLIAAAWFEAGRRQGRHESGH